MLCALAMMVGLGEQKVKASIGITTGPTFCGVIGHIANRREYTVIGDTINTAARLMQAASDRKAEIYIDVDTKAGLREELELKELELNLKGKGRRECSVG